MDMASTVAEDVLLSGNRAENQDHPLRGEGPVMEPSRLKFLELVKKKALASKEQPPKVNKDRNNLKFPKELSKVQDRKYAKKALDHYNANKEGPEYELVDPVDSNGIVRAGVWFHVSFTARPISSDPDDDASLKYFFAEVARPIGKKKSIFCVIVDPDSPDTIDGCRFCPINAKMYHPKSGFEVGCVFEHGNCRSRGDVVVHPHPVEGRDMESTSG